MRLYFLTGYVTLLNISYLEEIPRFIGIPAAFSLVFLKKRWDLDRLAFLDLIYRSG
jgi:hypothetical protein